MKSTSIVLNINSSDPQGLHAFYKDKVGLEVNPDSGERALWLGPNATIVFDTHSDVSGRTKEPARVLIDLNVDDINAAQAELEGRGITFLRSKGVEWWGGIISTFEDPDGNYIQIIQYDPSLATAPAGAATA